MTKADRPGVEDPDRFWLLQDEDEPLTLEEVIGQGIGAASMCWENPAGAGEFDSRRAAQIAKAIGDWVKVEWFPNQTMERANRSNYGTEPKFSDSPT